MDRYKELGAFREGLHDGLYIRLWEDPHCTVCKLVLFRIRMFYIGNQVGVQTIISSHLGEYDITDVTTGLGEIKHCDKCIFLESS